MCGKWVVGLAAVAVVVVLAPEAPAWAAEGVTEHASPMTLEVKLGILDRLAKFEDKRAIQVRVAQEDDLSSHACQGVSIGTLQAKGTLLVREEKVAVDVKADLRTSPGTSHEVKVRFEVVGKGKVLADKTVKDVEVKGDEAREVEATLKLDDADDLDDLDGETAVLRVILTVKK